LGTDAVSANLAALSNYGVQLSVGAPAIRAWLPFRRLRAACS
jgi:hypothetical protein